MYYECPRCKTKNRIPFIGQCPNCGFTIDHLSGKRLSDFQQRKFKKHTELLYSDTISLDGEYNASFTHKGNEQLEDLINFTISYGDRVILPSTRGTHHNLAIISYVPEIIGSGTTIYNIGYLPCSGICIVSPQSYIFGHPFPVIDSWVRRNFKGTISKCKICGREAKIGQPMCRKCYRRYDNNWKNTLK